MGSNPITGSRAIALETAWIKDSQALHPETAWPTETPKNAIYSPGIRPHFSRLNPPVSAPQRLSTVPRLKVKCPAFEKVPPAKSEES